ncbi:hypothetical protein MUU74_08140 [Chryseobacterium daecheongense]|uniref:hypothetical protein n=1 Tax=Chryseobacterium daecheongense TaxID=192389 RepID=UPI001FD6DDBD|nr:hypothetical protein [Chryseobacterium daecheongense]UOU99911.1 hypothetical protein MUU74_08140 [Chryseobacterium daecheongense]
MKRNLISRLLLLVTSLTVLYSCRNDHFPEQETYSNSSKYNLTSKTISLNESKHKSKLVSELGKAETQLKSRKTDASGKVVNYGNGVSIDTDHVIYIENGPNYHTYTFRINRENAPADAPVENLLLSPLPDGTYREFLITYNFTEQEKQIILSGGDVNRSGKVVVSELEKGTFGNPLSKESCSYQDVDVYLPCYTGDHHGGNVGSWGGCNWQSAEGGFPPQHYTLVALVCTGDPETIDTSTGISGGGSASGGGSGGGVISNPDPKPEPSDSPCTIEPSSSIEATLTDENGCPIGTPTLPNLGSIDNDPCFKTKKMLARPNVQQGINNVKAQALQSLSNVNAGETGFREKNDGTVVPADVNASHKVVYYDVTGSRGGYHNHTATGTHMFSPPDIADTLFGFASAQSIQDGVGNAYFGMIAAEWCNTCPSNVQFIHYVISFAGTGTELGGYVYTPTQMNQFISKYQRKVLELSNTSLNGNTYIKNSAGDLNEKGVEKLFIETLKIMNLSGKVNLQRVEPNGTVYNIKEDVNGMPIGTPCP